MLIVWLFVIAAAAFIAGALVMGFIMTVAAGPELERAIERARSGVAPGLRTAGNDWVGTKIA